MQETDVMEEYENPSVKSVSIKWGLINGLIGIVFFIIIDLAGQAGNQGLQWIGLLIFLVILILAHKEFKDEGNGFMTYGQGLGIGTLLAVISGMISNLFFLIYVSFISSDFIEIIKEKQIMEMEDKGMSDSEIDQAMGFAEVFMTPVAMSFMGLIFGVFFAFIVSLIVSIFTKNQSAELS